MSMKIENEKQYEVAKKQLDSLKTSLDASIDTTVEMPEEIYKAMLSGIRSLIEEMEPKVLDYENLSCTDEQRLAVVDLALNFVKSNTASEIIVEKMSKILDDEDVVKWERAIELARKYYRSL